MEEANRRVYEKSREDENLAGMGTTVVVAVIEDRYLYVANVGDSRLYLIRDDIRQITKDHSLVEEMVRSGKLKKEEARKHPNKNVITRAVGVERKVNIDFFDLRVRKGDKILLCSDGLSNMLEDERDLRDRKKWGRCGRKSQETHYSGKPERRKRQHLRSAGGATIR